MKAALLTNSVVVSSKGQLVVPQRLRAKLGIHTNSTVILTLRADGVLEIRPARQSIEAFFGCCKRTEKQKAMSVRDMDKAIMDAVSEEN